jgi:bis(5'-nucleosyl)-tetraphosphatase (symmetrical)
MANYAIGDIQGCFDEFLALLDKIKYSPAQDRLILLGDLVNRGPKSLAMLRWAYDMRHKLRLILGNHDLHLIAVHAGLAKQKQLDTIDDILRAPDADELLTWLRQQPLVIEDGRYVFVHAGLPPTWQSVDAVACSAEIQRVLSGPAYRDFLSHMYGNEPDRWDAALSGWDRLRFIVNACTRMRVLTQDGRLDLKYKGELADAPDGRAAWFDLPNVRDGTQTVVCGHWSALGLHRQPGVIALDTGCVWGGALTALRLEDGQVFQVRSQQPVTSEWG